MAGFSPVGANALVLYPEPFEGLRLSYLTELSRLYRVSNIPRLHVQTGDHCLRTTSHGKHVFTMCHRFIISHCGLHYIVIRMKTITL
jgi:hypothetical protein